MIFDGVQCTHNGTGGTGTLTLAAQTGYNGFSDVMTGTSWVSYTITEWTDSTKTTLLQRETGFGSYVNSSNTLVRSLPQSTWSGSVYIPKFNVATAATALSIGNTAANIDITCSPSASNHILPMYGYNDAGAAGADSIGIAPLSVPATSNALTYSFNTGTTYYFPVWINHIGPFSKASFRLTTSATSGTSPIPAIEIALYQPTADTGLPGKRLINFTSATVTATSPATITTTALATPIFIPPGWYYQAMLYLVGNGSGSPVLKAYTPITGMAGTSMANYGPITGINVGTQSSMTDPAPTPGFTNTGNSVPLVVFN